MNWIKSCLYLSLMLTIMCCESISESRFDTEKLINRPAIDSLGFKAMIGDTLSQGALLTRGYSIYQAYQQVDSSYWIGLSDDDYRLDFYSLNQKKAIRSVQFQEEGPNGITGDIDGFFYHNPDTIFVLSSDVNGIYLMNEQGEKIDRYDFDNMPLPDGFEGYSIFASNGWQNGPYYVASTKTLQLYTLKWYNNPNEYINHENFASYSIVDRSFVSIYGDFPDNYQEGDNFGIYDDPILSVVDTLSFVQFGASAYLAAYHNITGELLYVSNEHCNHWEKELEPVGSLDIAKARDWSTELPGFPVLLHDEVNKVLYRFLKHKQPLLDNTGLLNRRWFGTFCISIYDYSLQRLGHQEIPKNTFFPLYSFAAAGGIWIMNPKTPSDESNMLFYRLKLTNR